MKNWEHRLFLTASYWTWLSKVSKVFLSEKSGKGNIKMNKEKFKKTTVYFTRKNYFSFFFMWSIYLMINLLSCYLYRSLGRGNFENRELLTWNIETKAKKKLGITAVLCRQTVICFQSIVNNNSFFLIFMDQIAVDLCSRTAAKLISEKL